MPPVPLVEAHAVEQEQAVPAVEAFAVELEMGGHLDQVAGHLGQGAAQQGALHLATAPPEALHQGATAPPEAFAQSVAQASGQVATAPGVLGEVLEVPLVAPLATGEEDPDALEEVATEAEEEEEAGQEEVATEAEPAGRDRNAPAAQWGLRGHPVRRERPNAPRWHVAMRPHQGEPDGFRWEVGDLEPWYDCREATIHVSDIHS